MIRPSAVEVESRDEDGTPADPPTLHTAVPNRQAGDTIPLGRDRTLVVIEVGPGRSADDSAVLVVEPSQWSARPGA